MTTQELRNKAADYIEAHGWCQGDYETPNCEVCMVGAMGAVLCGNAWAADDDDEPLLTQAVVELGFDWHDKATEWNDKRGRTKEEVIARLRGVSA